MSQNLNLYLIDYWVPFPHSEYGGLVAVSANNENEAKDIALESSSSFDRRELGDEQLMENISQNIQLVGYTDMYDKPCIVNGFTT